MIKRVILLFVLFQIVSIALQSCGCEDKGKIIGIGSSQLHSLDETLDNLNEESGYYEISKAFKWILYAETESYAANSFALNEAYSTSPCEIETWLNEFNNRFAKLYFSDGFVFQNDSIEPRAKINSFVSSAVYQEDGWSNASIEFDFDSLFMSQAQFDTNLVYTLYFEGLTSDSIPLEDSIKISFDLD